MASTTLREVASAKAQQQEPRTPYESLKRQLESSKAEFLPLFGNSQQNVDRFIRVVLNAVLSNGDLLDADRRSLISACMKAAQDGLVPDGREAVLNIYNTKIKGKDGARDEWRKMAQYLPMVGGLIKKLYESGEITYVDAACVYANDRFMYRRGDEPKLEHEPTMADDSGQIVAAYVVIKLKNGEVKREVMPRRDIEAVRSASKSKDSGPWVTWYDQQAIKSVIKRAYKQLPKADAFEKLADYDNQALGFAATPQSVAEIAARKTAPALENSPTNSLVMPVHGLGDTVDAGYDVEDVHHQSAADIDPPKFAALADRLNKHMTMDEAALILDEGRALPQDQQDELQRLYDAKFAPNAA